VDTIRALKRIFAPFLMKGIQRIFLIAVRHCLIRPLVSDLIGTLATVHLDRTLIILKTIEVAHT
jgi:hypothetical protein